MLTTCWQARRGGKFCCGLDSREQVSPGLMGVIFSVGITSGFRGDPGAQWHGWFLFFIFFQNVSPMSPWMEDQRYFPGCKGEGCAPFGALTRGGPSPRSFPQPPFHLVLPTSGSNEEAPHSYSQQLWVNLGPPGRRAGGAGSESCSPGWGQRSGKNHWGARVNPGLWQR